MPYTTSRIIPKGKVGLEKKETGDHGSPGLTLNFQTFEKSSIILSKSTEGDIKPYKNKLGGGYATLSF